MHRLFLPRAILVGAAACLVPLEPVEAETPAFSVLKKRLLRMPMSDRTGTVVRLPVGDGTLREFTVRDSRTLPRALAAKFPGLRSFRGTDADGRTARLDLSSSGLRMSIRDGAREWSVRAKTTVEWAEVLAREDKEGQVVSRQTASPANAGLPLPTTSARSGVILFDFRLAVATSSRYAAMFGGTREGALAEVAHTVNRVNEVFETDVGVHFTLVANNDRLIRTQPLRDPFRREDPASAAVNLIDREIGSAHYDIGHALTEYTGGESHIGTSCSDARDADFLATHKAAAWSGHAEPETSPDAVGFMIHVLARQLGAWPTSNACPNASLDDRAFEPGRGSTAMSHAHSACGRESSLQAHADRYFHGANIEQMQHWLATRGGRCATRRINPATAPWIVPESLSDRTVIPARTPFFLDATVQEGSPGRRLSYTWEQMDPATERHGGQPDASGPLFRSFPPAAISRRYFPRLPARSGDEALTLGESLPHMSRSLNFRLTVRDNGGDTATVAHADKRVDVIDTGRPFAIFDMSSPTPIRAGEALRVRWDVAGTNQEPISCHFVEIDLSLDSGENWLTPALAVDESNDGETTTVLPREIASEHARLRVRCDWRPFFAVSPADFTIMPIATP